MIRQRVRDGLSVIKAKIERDGKFVSKAGNVRIRLGRPGAEADKLDRAREELAKGTGIIKTAKLIGLAGEESTLAIEGYRSDGAFDRIGVDLDAAMGRHSGAQCGCSESVALDQAQGPGKRDFAVEAMPLAGVAKVGQVETIAGNVFEAGEGRIEFPAGVVHKARTVALDESIVGPVPPPVEVDRIVELRWANLGKEARLQDLVDEGLAGTSDRGLVGLEGPPR